MTKRQWAIIQYALLAFSRSPEDWWDEEYDGDIPEKTEIDELIVMLDPCCNCDDDVEDVKDDSDLWVCGECGSAIPELDNGFIDNRNHADSCSLFFGDHQ